MAPDFAKATVVLLVAHFFHPLHRGTSRCSVMPRWDIDAFGAAPCQCLTPPGL